MIKFSKVLYQGIVFYWQIVPLNNNSFVQESEQITAEAKHSWLCDGRLLHLYDAVSPHNNQLFQEQWARGQPVIISNSDRSGFQ